MASRKDAARLRAVCVGLVALWSGAAFAQVKPPMEYGKYVQTGQSIQALGDSPFGEQVSLYDGGLSFRQVDFELPGTGPTIRIARTLAVRPGSDPSHTTGIG